MLRLATVVVNPSSPRPLFRRSASAGQVEWLRQLGLVRMFGAGVDLQLAELLATEPRLRDHSPDRTPDHLFRIVGKQIGVRALRQSTRVTAVVICELPPALSAVITTLAALTTITKSPVSTWGAKIGLCLPRSREPPSRHPAEDHAVGVDDVPLLGDLVCSG